MTARTTTTKSSISPTPAGFLRYKRRVECVVLERLARQLLADAGFVGTQVLPDPGDPAGAIYVCRRL
jgi:hypothetical protein